MSDLIKRIEHAFQNTPRGAIGLRQASAISMRYDENGGLFEDKKRYAQACAADVEENWQDIPDEVLAADSSVFSFLDYAGFKFVMPAIMCWSLRLEAARTNDVVESFVMKLLPFSRKDETPDVLVQKWALSKEQISVIVEWLEDYLSKYDPYPAALVMANFERWKQLANPSLNF